MRVMLSAKAMHWSADGCRWIEALSSEVDAVALGRLLETAALLLEVAPGTLEGWMSVSGSWLSVSEGWLSVFGWLSSRRWLGGRLMGFGRLDLDDAVSCSTELECPGAEALGGRRILAALPLEAALLSLGGQCMAPGLGRVGGCRLVDNGRREALDREDFGCRIG